MQTIAILSAFFAMASAHGVVLSVEGANGVSMPGLSIADGTPRDCSSNRCGSQADTSIIRDREIQSGRASALGRTQGNGPVDASVMISNFLGGGNANNVPTNNGSASSAGVEDDLSGLPKGNNNNRQRRQLGNLLGGLFGGGRGGGGEKTETAEETSVAASAGEGASKGLPTASDNGEVTMTYRQINQDGAGPMTADIDATSGGTDPSAFQSAEVTQDVPGIGIQGLSLATNTDFPLKVQMPQGMTCEGSVGGANNVCIVRVRNGAAAGPFGGSGAFTQSATARKRAIAYRLKKRMEIVRH
ncbi:gEgh 16 [Fusarium beomiforme]|uniref:GEgh 16 n=1 Tax=Fusarium beomiforme TaxID=44412 RepID=A0A9P5DX57_9HYPO|nr:gEgh 16 [Fusarium beomiforme]